MKKILLLCFSLFFITACEKTYTVDEFMKDDNLRKSFVAKCNNGELHREDLNCLNAKKADRNKTMLDGMTEHGTKF